MKGGKRRRRRKGERYLPEKKMQFKVTKLTVFNAQLDKIRDEGHY